MDLLEKNLGEYVNTEKDLMPFIDKIILTLGENEELYKMGFDKVFHVSRTNLYKKIRFNCIKYASRDCRKCIKICK